MPGKHQNVNRKRYLLFKYQWYINILKKYTKWIDSVFYGAYIANQRKGAGNKSNFLAL
nr:MAG TPA: hypothetical protein [Caudoviricetes sp.]